MNYQDGYSQKALDALAKGKYKSLRSSGLANYRYTEGKKKRDNAVVKQNKTQNPTPRNTNAMANDPRFFAPSVSLPVPTLPMVNAMQGDPRFQVQPEYNGDEVLNQLLGGVKSPVKDSPNLSDMIPKTPRKSDTKRSKAKPSTRYTNETEKDFLGGLMAEYADEHPFISTLNSLALNAGSTVEGIENALSGFLGESLFDPEKPVSDLYARRGLTKDSLAATKAKEGIRQTVQDNIDNGFGKFAYNTGTGLADMGINMAISGGNPVAMGVVSGAQNAAQNTLHARERGVDADKARKTGLATGVVAGVMNSVGLDSVLKSTAKTVAGQVLQGAGKEGLENVVEDIADIWIDNIINGDNSETSKTIQYYVQNGMSEEEAYKKSFVDYLNQELVSFASGAALGGAIGGAKKLPQLGAYVEGKLAERDARKNPTVAGILDGTITESPRVPDVVEQARAQAERAQAEVERLNEQLPEMPEETRPFTDMSPEEQAALQAELDNEYNFDANEVAANDTGIDSNPRITERSPFPEKADGSRPDYHNVEEVGTRLETTRQSIAKNTEDIEALNKQLNDIPDLKKNAKERSALKNQIYQLEQQNKQSAKLEKILTKISDGEKVSNKDIFEVEFPDDYHAIFDGRGGFFGRVNMATKFAGDTPEAKALAQSIRDDIYAIAKGDFDPENLGGLLEKVYNLDRMAQETKADYRARGTGKNPSRVYKYDDFFAGTKNGIGDDFTSHVIHSLDKAYQIANNMTDIDTTSRVAEAAGESAPIETPESVVAASNPTVPEVTGIDNRVPTAEQTPVETNRVPAVEQTTPANGDEKIRSFSKRGSQDDTLPDEIREPLSEDKYRVVRNADVETRANELFDPDNLIQSRSNLKQAIDNHDPAAALLSYKLAKAYVDSGEYDAATDVIKEAGAELTKSGQFTQAAKLAMMQNDPMAAMRSYMRDLEDLNKWGKKKYGKKWKELELSEEDVSEFGKVTPGDAENLNNLVNKLNNKFGKEVHASFWDKVVGATKTSMLLNIRTQMRNIVSNTAMLPVRSISDRVSALGQNIAHLINPNIEVTQSLVGGTRSQKKAAGELFESMKDSILGTNKMKDSNTADIHGHRQLFNDDFFARWIDNKTNGGIQKLNERLGADGNQSTMETLQNFTYWLMGDFGDTPFVKKNFENRLASYMKAQNIDNIKDVPDDAIALAIEESLKATFKDDNAFTKALQGVKQKTGKFGEIALPFVKTPANLAMRSIDYSPIGLINTFRKAKNGAEVNQVIDELAKNLTGTAMIYLGYKLREKGLLSGNYSEDKDEAAFQKQQGMLEHAFHIGDKYFTYDWLQPAAAPLEIGSVIFDAINNSDKENAGVFDALNSSVKGGLAVANSWIQSSPLQSLSDMLGNNPYGDEGVAENVLNEVIEFPQRLIPAQLGAIARSVDPTIRDTYIKDNTLTGIAGNQARQIVAKIPYLSKTLPASYDTWGNERTRTDTKWGGALAQNVNPGQLGNKNETPLDSEIQRLFDATGRGEVFPISASRSLTLGEETVNMTNKEHSEYQKMMGEQSYEMADTFMNSAAYKDMTDEERVNTLDSIYKLSNSIAKEKIFNYATDSDKELKEIYKAKGAQAAVDYLTQKSEAKNLGMSFSTYQKKEAEYEGGAEQYAQDKQTALDNGFVKSDGTANPDQYKKVMAQAGEYADKVLNDIPTLQSSGLPTSSYYTYAQAVNVVPSLSPSEFASTYKAIDTNPENAITQTEILEYINKKGYSQDQLEAVQDLWDMYKPSNSKKVPYLKDGIWKAKSK